MGNYEDYLTHRDYRNWIKCPDHMWIAKNSPKLLDELSEDLTMKLSEKRKTLNLAKELFPNGVQVNTPLGPDSESLKELESKNLRDSGEKILYSPFAVNHLEKTKASADFLVFNGQTQKWDIYILIMSSNIKAEHKQKAFFIEHTFSMDGWRIGETNLVYFNSLYYVKEKLNPKSLLKIANITSEKTLFTQNFSNVFLQMRSKLKNPTPPKTCNCILKTSSNRCKSFQIFYGKRKEDSRGRPYYELPEIFKLKPRGSSGDDYVFHKDLIDSGITEFKDIPSSVSASFSETLYRQFQATFSNKPLIDSVEVKKILKTFSYPLHFLDYETLSENALPLFENTGPYHKTVFQYSLDIANSPQQIIRLKNKSEIVHREYLHRDKSSPTLEICRHLKQDILPTGSILTWNMAFEKGRNRELAKIHPEYKDFLEDVNSRIIDLMEIFQKAYWVDKDFNFSYSLKNVLPVLCPELSYSDLAVHNGAEASTLWPMLVFGELSESLDKESIFNNLLEYCGQDTYAMVRILQEIYKEILKIK